MKSFYFNAGIINGKNEYNPAISSESNNILPDIAFEQVFEGTTIYRKLFIVPEKAITLLVICIGIHSPGYYLHVGTANDSDASDYIQWKGTGILESAITKDSKTLTVNVEEPGLGFSVLDIIRISDGVNYDFARIKSISWYQKKAVINLMPNGQLARDYSAGSLVSSCIERSRAGINSIWIKNVIPQDARIVRNQSVEILGFM